MRKNASVGAAAAESLYASFIGALPEICTVAWHRLQYGPGWVGSIGPHGTLRISHATWPWDFLRLPLGFAGGLLGPGIASFRKSLTPQSDV